MVLLALVVVQKKLFGYHWQGAMLMLPIISILGISRIQEIYVAFHDNAESARTRFATWLFSLLLTIPIWWEISGTNGIFVAGWKYLCGQITREEYYSLDYFDSELLPTVQEAEYFRQNSTENQTILVWGYGMVVNYLADRRPPSRFGFIYPLITGKETIFYAKYRKQFIQELKSRPPDFFVFDPDKTLIPSNQLNYDIRKFPELETFLKANYSFQTRIDKYTILKLNSGREGRPAKAKEPE
jgi:hypothetical protein